MGDRRGPAADSRAALRLSERLRRSYRPDHVKLLFVGEAPPASGRFFYRGDSGLYRAMLAAFRAVTPSLENADFLAAFKSSGCYLADLCADPVDRLDRQPRQAACSASEPALCNLIREIQPSSMATVVRSIRGNVERAASQAGWTGSILDLPYPGRWSSHRDIFVERLAPELKAIPMSITLSAHRG